VLAQTGQSFAQTPWIFATFNVHNPHSKLVCVIPFSSTVTNNPLILSLMPRLFAQVMRELHGKCTALACLLSFSLFKHSLQATADLCSIGRLKIKRLLPANRCWYQ
jgi:hypothetical protein